MTTTNIGRTVISHQKARAMAGGLYRMLKRGYDVPSRDGSCWVCYSGSYYYTRPL